MPSTGSDMLWALHKHYQDGVVTRVKNESIVIIILDFFTNCALWTAHFYLGLVQWSAWIMHIKYQWYHGKEHPITICPTVGFKLLNHNSLSSNKILSRTEIHQRNRQICLNSNLHPLSHSPGAQRHPPWGVHWSMPDVLVCLQFFQPPLKCWVHN